jgi:tRNA threonylcarbamoyladenosine biosynthesis protein TsaB
LQLDSLITKINSRITVRRLDKKPVQVLLIGDAAHNHAAELQERLGEKSRIAPVGHDYPRAAHLLDVGIPLIEAGETHDPDTFAPEYLQLVEAEVKWLAAQGSKGGDGK